jgi:hypothetical protein
MLSLHGASKPSFSYSTSLNSPKCFRQYDVSQSNISPNHLWFHRPCNGGSDDLYVSVVRPSHGNTHKDQGFHCHLLQHRTGHVFLRIHCLERRQYLLSNTHTMENLGWVASSFLLRGYVSSLHTDLIDYEFYCRTLVVARFDCKLLINNIVL